MCYYICKTRIVIKYYKIKKKNIYHYLYFLYYTLTKIKYKINNFLIK